MTSVAIIGGYGGMGQLFSKILKKDGLGVVITGPREVKGREVAGKLGLKYEKDNKKAASEADIVIITVPIRKTLDVIKEIAPVVKKGSLLMDLTSIKKEPCEAMERFAKPGVEIVGTHPVFGPTVGDFKGQNFVLCKIRGDKRFNWLKNFLEKKGARVTVCKPEEHDEAMGVVQGMTHFMLISAGMAMDDLKFDLEQSRRFSSPVYDLILDLVGRILAQDPHLYGEIQLDNKKTREVRKAFLKAAQRLDDIVNRGDEAAFIREMEAAARHFADTRGAMERTNKLLKK
jgi:prephenate dehydrogenase